MKELTEREFQWLEAFAKLHGFFHSFLVHYQLKKYLTNTQYYWFHLYVIKAEDDGNNLLNDDEIIFLEEYTPIP